MCFCHPPTPLHIFSIPPPPCHVSSHFSPLEKFVRLSKFISKSLSQCPFVPRFVYGGGGRGVLQSPLPPFYLAIYVSYLSIQSWQKRCVYTASPYLHISIAAFGNQKTPLSYTVNAPPPPPNLLWTWMEGGGGGRPLQKVPIYTDKEFRCQLNLHSFSQSGASSIFSSSSYT